MIEKRATDWKLKSIDSIKFSQELSKNRITTEDHTIKKILFATTNERINNHSHSVEQAGCEL
jgi:hypothetical protein